MLSNVPWGAKLGPVESQLVDFGWPEHFKHWTRLGYLRINQNSSGKLSYRAVFFFFFSPRSGGSWLEQGKKVSESDPSRSLLHSSMTTAWEASHSLRTCPWSQQGALRH